MVTQSERDKKQRKAEMRAWAEQQWQSEAEKEEKEQRRLIRLGFFDPDCPERNQPARPSKYGVDQLTERLIASEGIDKAYVDVRISPGGPRQQERLEELRLGTVRTLRDLGVETKFAYAEIADGKRIDPDERPKLFKCFHAAVRDNLPVIIPGMTRLLRGDKFGEENRKDVPTIAKLELFLARLPGARIICMNDPDALPPDDEKFLRKLHSRAKRQQDGRKKVEWWGIDLLREWVPRWLKWDKQDVSYSGIADKTYAGCGHAPSLTTIAKWIRNPKRTYRGESL